MAQVRSQSSYLIYNYSTFTFVHIHTGTVASGSLACWPLGLVDLCYTVPPFHCWGRVA